MTKRAILGVSFMLAGPVFLEESYAMLLGGIITAIVGGMSVLQLAAYTLATIVQTSAVTVCGVIGIGAAALVAREIGAGNRNLLRRIIGQTLSMGTIGGILLSLVGFSLADSLCLATNIEFETALLTGRILELLFLFTPFQLLMLIGKAILRGMGETKLAFGVGAMSNTVLLIVTYLLVFGCTPGFGVYGAVWGAGISELIGAFLALGAIWYSKIGFGLRDILFFDIKNIKRIARISFPVAWEQVALQIGFTIYTFELATVGTKQFAANQIAQQLESIPQIIGIGLGAATLTVVGQSQGKQLPSVAEKFTRFVNWITVVLMTALGIVVYFLTEPLLALFVHDSEVINWTAACMLFSILELPPLATELILGNALRGAGDTRWPAYSTIVGVGLVRIPLTYLLIDKMAMAITVAWIITAGDHLVRCAILASRFFSGGWRQPS